MKIVTEINDDEELRRRLVRHQPGKSAPTSVRPLTVRDGQATTTAPL